MSAPWFVSPDTDKIELTWEAPDGSEHPLWIEVKHMLTVGEDRAVMRAVSKVKQAVKSKKDRKETDDNSTTADLDWTEYSFARMLAYLVDWSLADEKGNKVKISREQIGNFHESLFELIDKTIDAHVESREQEKKAPSSGRGRKRTST